MSASTYRCSILASPGANRRRVERAGLTCARVPLQPAIARMVAKLPHVFEMSSHTARACGIAQNSGAIRLHGHEVDAGRSQRPQPTLPTIVVCAPTFACLRRAITAHL